MIRGRRRRLERQIFLALLTAILLPTALLVGGGAWLLGDVLRRGGSGGPWTSVAASGADLERQIQAAWPPDSPIPDSLTARLDAHAQALRGSAEMSRLYSALGERALQRLPWAVLLLGLAATGMAWLAARRLARGFAAPVSELVTWTQMIAREEPLPEADPGTAQELAALSGALRTLATEVSDARDRAVEAARMSTWTAAARRVAHEIKNPLTPMTLAARQLRDRAGDEANREAAEILLEEVQRLDSLARTFTQIGTPPDGPPAPVDLAELAHEVAATLTAASAPVRVDVEGAPPLVEGHHAALRSALRNLVVNALEATSAATDAPPVNVYVEAMTSGDRAGVVVRVEDSGTGLPEALGDAIWNLDVTTKRRGSGIGLAMVRQTAALHDGWVSAEPRAEGGARFQLWLPA